jgi:pimeloyl-ACP methyl ester carboxylesterase
MVSVYANHGDVRIHALDNERDGDGAPFVVVPGMGEMADEYAWMLDALGSRRVLAVDVRGRGPSDAPARGYTWEDHYGDVLAVLADLGIERPVILGNSRGAGYALGAALHAPGGVRGVVINDYLARHAALGPDMVDKILAMPIRGKTGAERMTHHVVERVVNESVEVPLWDRLAELDCPVLVVHGGRASSIVTPDVAERYRAALPSVQIACLEHRGHDVWSRDIPAYLEVLLPFLEAIDAA